MKSSDAGRVTPSTGYQAGLGTALGLLRREEMTIINPSPRKLVIRLLLY